MDTNFRIKKDVYDKMKKASIIGLGLTFFYYLIGIETYPSVRGLVDFLGIFSFAIWLLCVVLTMLNKVTDNE